MPNVALLNSTTDHGGTIITASSDVLADGIGIARLGDLHDCPVPGHGITPIITASSLVTANLRGIARIGDQTGCGAVINSGSTTVQAN